MLLCRTLPSVEVQEFWYKRWAALSQQKFVATNGCGLLASLRCYPKTSLGISELSQHEPDGCQAQEGQRLAVEAFPILGKIAVRINADLPFSALWTLWLSMIAAVGLASRPACSRHRR